MELLGCLSCSGSEMLEVVVQVWVGAVEGIKIEYVNALAFVDHQ